MTDAENEGWLFQFRKPGYAEMMRVAEFLKEAKICEYKGRKRSIANIGMETSTEDDDLPLEGTFDELFSLLSEKLEEDFAENSAERRYNPWDFDYVITNDLSSRVGAVSIWTRIYNPHDTKMGSSLYGLHVVRIAEDKYLIWIDY